MGSLYLIRHAQASFGAQDYDVLSPLGHEQARLLGLWLQRRGLSFDRVLQGTMRRHSETAAHCLAAAHNPPEIVMDARLNEFDHQAILEVLHPSFRDPLQLQLFLSKTAEPAKAFHLEFDKALQRWMSGDFDKDYAETWSEFKRRCLEIVRETIELAEPQHNLLAITSGGPIATIVQKALGLADAAVLPLNTAIVNGSMTRLAFKNDRLFLRYFNDYSHFEVDGCSRLTHR